MAKRKKAAQSELGAQLKREKLFSILTIELLAHKYLYYVEARPAISDSQYDQLERAWENEGRRLGFAMDDYSPWVDFPEEHPLAEVGKTAAPEVSLASWAKCLDLAGRWDGRAFK